MIEIPCQQLIAMPSVSDHLSRSTNYRALSITVLKQIFFLLTTLKQGCLVQENVRQNKNQSLATSTVTFVLTAR